MNRDRKYDKWRPLLQAERGDSIIITVSGPNKKKIPCGKYKGIYQGDYRITCEAEPRLNGAYTYWYGQKWGDGWIFAELEENMGGNQNGKI